MQMCKPACEGTYSETQKVNYSSSSKGCYSKGYGHHEHQSSECSTTQAGHQIHGMHQKHPSHDSSQGGYLSEHKRHEHKHAGCATNQSDGHHMGGNMHKHPSHAGGHLHGFTEKITGYFHGSGSSHDQKHGHHNSSHCHDQKHGHHNSNHRASYVYTEKKEEHKSYKSGHTKSKMKIKEKSFWKGNCKDGSNSSDSESDDEARKISLALI